MSHNRETRRYNLFTAQGATGTSEQIFVSDFRNAVISFGAAAANLTVKVRGGIIMQSANESPDAPDLKSATSATNVWDYIEVVDLEDGAGIDGDTGIAWAATSESRIVELNINALDYIVVEVSAYTGGTISAFLTLADNL